MEDSDSNGIITNEIILSSRDSPRTHNGADPVLCEDCQEVDLLFFDPSCLGCLDILKSPKTTIAQIFAIIRQWVPQTQQNIDLFIKEIFARGAHVNDKDGLTDMTLLHYAAKSGANGVGDIGASLAVVKFLIEQGVDVHAKCTWTDMSALQYAVFFDIEPVVEFLLLTTNGENIDTNCKEFDNGTALHIGATNLCLSSVKTLIKFGANPHFLNKFGKTPLDCIPTDDDGDECTGSIANSLRSLLKGAMQDTATNRTQNLTSSTLQALGLELHGKVVVGGNVGELRFCGPTDFASGQWAGIELQEPLGKNDGSVAGIRYFNCTPKYGIFAPLTRIHKYDGTSAIPISLNVSIESSPSSTSATGNEIVVDSKVVVEGEKVGIVRYVGPTKFAAGVWVGIEADHACGKSDGSIGGVQYFQCKPKHGLFVPINKVKLLSHGDVSNDTLETEKNGTISNGTIHNGDNDSGGNDSGDKENVTFEIKSTSNIPVATNNKKTKKKTTSRQNSQEAATVIRRNNVNRRNSENLLSISRQNSKDSSNVSRRNSYNCDQNNSKDSSNVSRRNSYNSDKLNETSEKLQKKNSNLTTLSQPKKTQKVDKTFGAEIEFALKEGMSVYANNEVGIVRYIGKVEFAEDVWLGIELRTGNGKNDGMVENKRYFTCKPSHGLMVRPSRVTCRGINCAHLVDKIM